MLVNHVNPVKNWVQYVSNPAIERLDSRITKCISATNRTTCCYWLCWYASETFAYDDDGNQTLVTTFTGRWRVTYNGENRPILWVRDSDNTTLTMSYDHMGRRREKNAQRFFYDGYLQVADNGGNVYVWDCTEPVATRPLAWFNSALDTSHSALYYAHDGNKNVSEVFGVDDAIVAHYEYAPFGAVTTHRGTSAATNPWRFSSEYAEDDTMTVYYNYRHYEPIFGRWFSRDPIEEAGGENLYMSFFNDGIDNCDLLGQSWLDGNVDNPPTDVGPYESLIPIYGSLREFDKATYDGQWGKAVWYGAMFVADVFLVKSIVQGLAKGCWKLGSHSWRMTRRWIGKTRSLEAGTHVHHQFIPQKIISRHSWLKTIANQPWNLNAIQQIGDLTSAKVHQLIHVGWANVQRSGKTIVVKFNSLQKYWYSYSVGAKLFHLYILDRFYEKMVFERVIDKCSGR